VVQEIRILLTTESTEATEKDWEQGRRTPTGPAMNLLRLYEAMPEATTKILSEDPAVAP